MREGNLMIVRPSTRYWISNAIYKSLSRLATSINYIVALIHCFLRIPIIITRSEHPLWTSATLLRVSPQARPFDLWRALSKALTAPCLLTVIEQSQRQRETHDLGNIDQDTIDCFFTSRRLTSRLFLAFDGHICTPRRRSRAFVR